MGSMSDEQPPPPESTASTGDAPRSQDGRWLPGGPSPNPGGRRLSVKEAQDEAAQYKQAV
jgi:hypothetical protein